MSETESAFQHNGPLEVTVADYPIYARIITDRKDYCYPCKFLERCEQYTYTCKFAHDTRENEWPCVYENAKAMACARRILTLESENEQT